jgi:hypothetical protein
MIVIFSGSRHGTSDLALREVFNSIPRHALVMHGDARGVDTQVDNLCKELGFDRVKVPANWEGRSRQAGSQRNVLMLEMAYAIAQKRECVIQVYAFPGPESKGTWHMVSTAKTYGIPVGVYHVKS